MKKVSDYYNYEKTTQAFDITEKMILKYFIKKNMTKLALLDISTPTGQREMHKLAKKIAKDKNKLKKLDN